VICNCNSLRQRRVGPVGMATGAMGILKKTWRHQDFLRRRGVASSHLLTNTAVRRLKGP
jgi:hypothetical protein